MAYRNKVYVAFDGDEDINHYRLLTAWAANTNDDFELNNAHDLNKSYDDSQEETIKRHLRRRFNNSKLFILLVGEHTKNLRKFVRWEIETAIKMDIPIIAVNLNKNRGWDERTPKLIRENLSISVAYKEKIIKYAMEYWPAGHKRHTSNNENKGYRYTDSVYEQLNI